MKHISFFVFLFIVLSGTSSLWAGGKHPATGSKIKEKQYTVDFIRNKGQWNEKVKFKAELHNGVFFLTDNGFVYNFIDQHVSSDRDSDSLQNHYHAYKVAFEGSNKNTWFTNWDERTYYYNYYIGNDPAHWATGVGIYGKVMQHNIYDGIDMVVYSERTGLKYDFLVAPGHKAAQIKLSYEGVQPTLTAEGSLKITTTVNEITEQKPYCYQVVNGKTKVVPSRYKITGRLVTYEFPEGYDESVPLVIDPTVVFSTYSGASYIPPPSFYAYAGLYQHATTYDGSGKLYSSVTINSLGWPVTMGAYQATPDTKRDIGINVFNTDGTSLAYATYFGGAANEIALTMLTNEQNELFIAGSTRSENLPTTTGCYDNTYNGSSVVPTDAGTDIFVAHFNSTGTQLLGATYIGGNENELVPSSLLLNVVGYGDLYGMNIISPVEIALDSADNIWLVSNTISTNFPVTTNAQQPTYAGGQTDIVLCKFNSNCSQLLYSSYLGSAGFDIGNSIVFNKNGELVICGATSGNNFPVSTNALVTNAPGGTSDGFVAIVNPTNGSLMYSTYLGTNLADQACIVQVDDENNVYVAGRTYGNYPISNSTFSMAGGDVFLQKLDPLLSASVASTRIGASQTAGGRLIPTGFVITECNDIIFSGFSHSGTIALPTTNNALDAIPKRFWFCNMKPDFSNLNYASFWGAPQMLDSRHCGTHHYDPRGIIYQSLTSSTSAIFPTTAGSWSPGTQINIGSKGDVVSFKIAFASLKADFILDAAVNDNDSGCAPYDIQVVNTSSGASSYVWDFGDGSALETSATPLLHTYATPGNYTITLYASNDTACVETDTAFMLITVVAPALLPGISTTDSVICSDLQTLDISVQISNPNPNFEVLWTPATGIQGPANQATITVNPALNDVYHVTVTDDRFGLCMQSATDSVTVTLAPNMLQLFTQDTTVCQGQVVQVSATGNPQYAYSWSPSIGTSDSTVLETAITVNQPQNYALTASFPGCPDTVLYLDIDMHYYPTVNVGPDKSFCAGTNVALESSASPYRNDYIYSWTPATPNLSNPNGPNAHFIADTTVTYTLNVATPLGCAGSDDISIIVFPGVNGDISPDTGFCSGGQVQLLATGGTSYRWTPSYGLSDTTISAPVADPATSTEYIVVIKNEHNCVDTQKVMVQVFSNAVLNMPDSITVYPGEQYQLEPATNCLYFSWFPPSGINATDISNPIFDPEVRTRYFVTATTEYGCSLKDSIDVLVKETIIDMPNAFMPTGANNLFKPSFRGMVALKAFNIFNRWGNKVYTSTDINSGWDGNFNGSAQPMGVYVYIVEAVTDTGRVFTKKGNVTLIR